MADVNKTVTFTVTYHDNGSTSISQETPADLQTMLTIWVQIMASIKEQNLPEGNPGIDFVTDTFDRFKEEFPQ
jgi:tRNA(Ile2) C34 agmatinyltransferase TiaS